MTRKLASIQRISAIRPIVGADAIEAADVLGWTVVVKKGDFQVGDLAVYFEIDSWLDSSNPAFATFEERFTSWGEKRGMRLKTIKLRKQISQGLLLSIDSFVELSVSCRGLDHWQEGSDITDTLKIEKWESLSDQKESNGPNKTAGGKPWPSFLQKTDQERVQNYVNELERHKDETFQVTIKLDGSSMTVFHVSNNSLHYGHCIEDMEVRMFKKMKPWSKLWYNIKKRFGFVELPENLSGVCSRNIQLPHKEDNHFSKFYRDNNLAQTLSDFCNINSSSGIKLSLAVQGELVAPCIQNNHEQVKDFEFYVYDIFNIDTQEYLKPKFVKDITSSLGWKHVPILREDCKLQEFSSESDSSKDTVEAILQYAEGPGMNKGVKREGVVFKSNKSNFSFKAISNSYLLKKETK